ncbi:hypothetical protein PIB30_101244, partial [Stylosanthes scabra]|nr:hypothetical protein [Stylosanthes scabra]
PKLPAPLIAYDVSVLGRFGTRPIRFLQMAGGQIACTNPVKCTSTIARVQIVGRWLSVPDASRIRISVTTSGGFIGRGIEV